MALDETVHIHRRFQRSIRIDKDVDNPDALEGFICPQSSSQVLKNMAKQISESQQGSFIWTGPYGSGKSSLVVALTAILGKNKNLEVGKNIDKDTYDYLNQSLLKKNKKWRYFPVVGTKADPVLTIGNQLNKANFLEETIDEWSEELLVSTLTKISNDEKYSGMILFIDEMGKFLESVVNGDGDIYLFQQLAEAANRSNGRLVIVGILHQAFEEYGGRLTREMRDEWTKIQGRFSDLAVNAAGEEQIELISQAIVQDKIPSKTKIKAKKFSEYIISNRPGVSKNLHEVFDKCWPLHPVVSSLLGPISRRRFGQNQRSIFGFLNSAEPLGFQDFLKTADESDLFEGHHLYDYLKINLEPSILASPDAHRWSLAIEAIERCLALEDVELIHQELLKTIAVIDLFKERSGLLPSKNLMPYFLSKYTKNEILDALDFLEKKSLIIFRKFNKAFAIYAGSDFDIEKAIEEVKFDFQEIDFETLKEIASLTPILAKRHYHETGAQRWFDFDIVPFSKLEEGIEKTIFKNGSVGKFLLAMATDGEDVNLVDNFYSNNTKLLKEKSIILGFSDAKNIIDLTRETLMLDHIRLNNPELSSDSVARREVESLLDNNRSNLEIALGNAFDSADWYFPDEKRSVYTKSDLNKKASELSDKLFEKSPIIHNELLNRLKPSSSAASVKRALIHRMVNHSGKKDLAINGYPPEYSLFKSVLESTGIYTEREGKYFFAKPETDPKNVRDMWEGALKFFETNKDRNVDLEELYDFWRQPPYGIKDGLMPIFAIAIFKSSQSNLVCYREGIFQTQIDELFSDYLMHSSQDIQVRWVNIDKSSKELLMNLVSLLGELDPNYTLTSSEPLEVGKAFISLFDRLPDWTKKTLNLSKNAKLIRTIFKKANDPNKFIFDDLPSFFGLNKNNLNQGEIKNIVKNLRNGLEELISSYPSMIDGLRIILLSELQVPNYTDPSEENISDLKNRASNIKDISGDVRQEAFINRIISFTLDEVDMEGIISLMVNKPPNLWVDSDIEKARLEIAVSSRRFKRDETFAHVAGRKDKRHSLAVVVSQEGVDHQVMGYSDFSDKDRLYIDKLKKKILADLSSDKQKLSKSYIAAALAELSMEYLETEKDDELSNEVNKA